jgi:hypothetical protein
MKLFVIGGLSSACIAVSIYLATRETSAPAPTNPPEPAPVVVAPPAKPAAPVVLPNVVEVADLDPLLDPPEKPVTGAPFDAEPATAPVSTSTAPERIPPAVDKSEIVPMPREMMETDPARSCWYGTHRFPRQISGVLSQEELLRDLRRFQDERPTFSLGGSVGLFGGP